MAFLRQCLQEARSRSGDLDGWSDLTASTGTSKDSTDDCDRQQAWYPMSIATRNSCRAHGPVAETSNDLMPDTTRLC